MAVEVLSVELYHKGHPAKWDGEVFRYVDTGEEINEERPCAKCGKPPTPEGYDACIGHLPGAYSVCCGHGVERGYILWEPDITGGASQIIEEMYGLLATLSMMLEDEE